MCAKKILFTASIPLHIRAFHLPYLEWLQKQGYEIHVATNGFEDLPFVDKYWNIPFSRTPFSLDNITAYTELKQIIENENFALIHCHTPVTSVITRLASIKARQRDTKLLYTAHGFHFFKGASVLNWMVFYPVEIFLSKYTDAIICINQEDFNRIQKKGSQNCNYHIIPGIGVNKSRFNNAALEKKSLLRSKYNFKADEFLLIYAAEFITRKNHEFIIKTVKNKTKVFRNTRILFAGKGELEESLKDMVKKAGLQNYIQFLGFRKDIHSLYKIADVGISSSTQEGLAINLVEEMMCGLPIIASKVRGHNEVVNHNINGFLFEQNNEFQFCKYVLTLRMKPNLSKEFSTNAIIKAQKFEIENSLKKMVKIYRTYLTGNTASLPDNLQINGNLTGKNTKYDKI